MAHKDGVFCDEGFKCKKCKEAWGRPTQIEQLTARVRELELVVSLKDEAIAERTDRVRELEEENARLKSSIDELKSRDKRNDTE